MRPRELSFAHAQRPVANFHRRARAAHHQERAVQRDHERDDRVLRARARQPIPEASAVRQPRDRRKRGPRIGERHQFRAHDRFDQVQVQRERGRADHGASGRVRVRARVRVARSRARSVAV